MNFLENKFNSDKVAIIYDKFKYTYKDLVNRISFFSDLIFSNQIHPGEIVIIKGNYSIDAISLFFALCKNKNIIVPIISENNEELKKKINISNASTIIEIKDLNIKKLKVDTVENEMILSLIKNEKSGLILFSSGSTGEPKAMLHDLDNLISTYKSTKKRNLVFLVFLMFDHIGGLNTMLNILSMQSTMVLPVERSPNHMAH
jgi:Acyl-CoA synthetases (AMP-forming)/AMP-acid ligases II